MKSRLSDHISSESLNESSIRTDYSAYAMNQVSRILAQGIDDQAVSRTEVEAVTIDGATSLDLDDAIWAEKTKNGYTVWVHISDVSEAIDIFSPLDREALQRTTSIYRHEHILDMIPPELSNNTLSLEPYGGKKLTQSLQIDLDTQGNMRYYGFYESKFTSLKRYDYESFGEDFINPDGPYFDMLQTLKQVSDRLRAQRLLQGGILHWGDNSRRVQLGSNQSVEKTPIAATTKIAHDIIESIMVLSNVTTGQHLVDSHLPSLLKRHDSLGERSYYHHAPDSFHTALGTKNYAHFTSPIRRYPDLMHHRIIKADIRGEEIPYTREDSSMVAKHVNNTRWKIETLGGLIDAEKKGEEFVLKTQKRLGRPLEVYDMKHHIRNATEKSRKLPRVMRESIAQRIESGNTGFWTWAIGVILLGEDNELKLLMQKRIIEDRILSPTKFLSILSQTQILRGEGAIFEFETHEDSGAFSCKILCNGSVVAKAKGTEKRYGSMGHLIDSSKRELIGSLFEYYVGET